VTDVSPDDEVHELDRAVSQLFLSCDLTGSTDFKQRVQKKSGGRSGGWQKFFLQFYRDFPQQLAISKRELKNADIEFSLWKPVGDELIYACEVVDEDEIYRAVRTWIAAMKEYEKEDLEDTPMGTKGGGFIATFPSPDSKSSVPRIPDSEISGKPVSELNRDAYDRPLRPDIYLYDYFGPSIDTGFRLLGKSDERYFPISVEVALSMIRRSKVPGSDQAEFHVDDLILLDFVELKGVWGGRRCPVIAIDLEYDDAVNQAYSKFENRSDATEIEALCLACLESADWPSQLYLPQSVDDRLKVKPAIPTDPSDVSSEGAEEKAPEPADPVALEANPPLGEVKYRTGFVQFKGDSFLTDAEAKTVLRGLAAAEMGLDEFESRFRMRPRVPTPDEGKTIFSADWSSMKNVGPKSVTAD
jgi:hypothetical protein